MEKLTQREARRYLLSVQGLRPPRELSGRSGVIKVLGRLKCLQFDPIDIVGRNHEIALQARVKGFNRKVLNSLLYEERVLVEGWDKQMSFGPMEDRPFFARDRLKYTRNDRYAEHGPLREIFPLIRREIKDRGPLSSLEIENDSRIDWSWAPGRAVRAAMEALWFRGELIIHHREGSRRYFDFTSRLLPAKLEDPISREEKPDEDTSWPLSAETVLNNEILYREWRIARRIASAGALSASSGDGWLGLDLKAGQRRRSIESLCDKEVLEPMIVEGLKEPLYRLKNDGIDFHRLSAAKGENRQKAAILAPLDNLLWDRNLIRQIFDFDYVWEVYKPQALRRWGYYVLPVLYGDRLIARFEPGRDRKLNQLIVKRWWNEAGVSVNQSMAMAVAVALRNLARSNGLESVHISTEASNQNILKSFL